MNPHRCHDALTENYLWFSFQVSASSSMPIFPPVLLLAPDGKVDGAQATTRAEIYLKTIQTEMRMWKKLKAIGASRNTITF